MFDRIIFSRWTTYADEKEDGKLTSVVRGPIGIVSRGRITPTVRALPRRLFARVLAGVVATLAAAVCLPLPAARADIAVAIYFVDLTGMSAEAKFYACGNPQLAGPFMSAATAIEWRNEFLQTQDTQRIISTWSNEPGVCTRSPWFHGNQWHQ